MKLIDIWFFIIEKIITLTEIKNISYFEMKKIFSSYLEKIRIDG